MIKKAVVSILLFLTCCTTSACGRQQEEAVSPISEQQSESPEVQMSGQQPEASTVPKAEQQSITEQSDSQELSPVQITEPTKDTITITMVGDILFHTPVAESGLQQDGTYDFSTIFAQTSSVIQEADLAIVNQEVIIGGEELGVTGYPSFNAPYELGDALIEAGFDMMLHGTNHALDKGKKGLLNCLNFWEENYPEAIVLGIHDSEADQEEITIWEENGIRIAVLNYTYGTNGIALPSDMPYAVDLLEKEKVVADLAKAEEEADFTIVCPHWGTEYRLEPSAEQEKWTEIFLENGVDLILGTHPHVIEPIEWVTGENGESMLVYYSLGNFVNWTSSSGAGIANRMVGGMAQIELQRTEQGEVTIADYGVEPLVCHLEEGTNGVTVYFLEDYTQELAQRNAICNQDSAFSLEYCQELCRDVWGELK